MVRFNKILVANRGEIAIRIMRAANEIGKKTVAVYAQEDRLGLHRFKADEAYRIGEGLGPVGAYLSIDEIIRMAQMSGADAIHPGYGLLSENPNFVDACQAAGIKFIGPRAKTMRQVGDKASARQIAIAAGVPVVPASDVLPDDMNKVQAIAAAVGYPLMLKASWGGGGRGMRMILSADELQEKVLEGRREAQAAFGNSAGYLERLIENARHVEVQLLGDSFGKIYHLYERDCSIQRRNQKVVERAPAPYLSEEQRAELCDLGCKICSYVNYESAGTVEFLMDMRDGAFYFIEVNPRIQVEHTVTEEVTSIDIVRAQIRIAEGADLAQATGAKSQAEVRLNGHALQARITTEDPQNNFIPDYGRISAYRSATGLGVRLDGGTAYSGAVITRYYDSLLVKVTTKGPNATIAIARMDRALREFRIRGVCTNIAFVINLLKHKTFLNNQYTTRFIDTTPNLFDFKPRRDRATRLLNYIAEVSVNGHPDVKGRLTAQAHIKAAPSPVGLYSKVQKGGVRYLLESHGATAVSEWLLNQKRLLVTDTTMRDSHQSLLATRMRSFDMVKIAPAYNYKLPNLFSMECWGGATFDVAYRFLQECPWQRLRDLRNAMPNLLLQMLLRASNGVGYTNYPDNVIEEFIRQSAVTGVDIFRVFDPMNWVENMRVAMDAVLASDKILEATICYSGDILDPSRKKYNLDYYLEIAQALKSAGTHILGLKDMAGLLKPNAATVLVTALKREIGLPVHFHTHDTSGIAAASVLAAAAAGVDIVDLAMDAFSGGTSQPCLGSIVEALRHSQRDTGLNINAVREINFYWQEVRKQYRAFDVGLRAPASEVYLHEMPGGQFTNLQAQARALGLEKRWGEIAKAYADVNQMFGDIIKVTPTSKVVGDMALLMVSQGLNRVALESSDIDVVFPDSVIDMLSGNMGQPHGGFPTAIVKKVLRGQRPDATRPGERLAALNFSKVRKELSTKLAGIHFDDEDLNGYLMYPEVFLNYAREHVKYGPVRTLPTQVYFYGMKPGDEIEAEIDPGKTLEIQLTTIGDTDEEGKVGVFFELNGHPRTVRVVNRQAAATAERRVQADANNWAHIGAPMPGVISNVMVIAGQSIQRGDLLCTIEAMKMETGIHSENDASVKCVYTPVGSQVDAKDLLIELE